MDATLIRVPLELRGPSAHQAFDGPLAEPAVLALLTWLKADTGAVAGATGVERGNGFFGHGGTVPDGWASDLFPPFTARPDSAILPPMHRPIAAALLIATATACAPKPESQARAIDIEIAQARQAIRSIEADVIRRQGDRAATAYEFADSPADLQALNQIGDLIDAGTAKINPELIAGYQRRIADLERRRAALNGSRP